MNRPQEILRQHQLRKTPIRERVLDVFLSKSHALSKQDIEDAFDGVDRITLYRTLKTFEEKGIIHQAVDGTAIAKFALCAEECSEHAHHDHHIHFHCNRCQQTLCIDQPGMHTISKPQGFEVHTTQIMMQGYCRNCRT